MDAVGGPARARGVLDADAGGQSVGGVPGGGAGERRLADVLPDGQPPPAGRQQRPQPGPLLFHFTSLQV